MDIRWQYVSEDADDGCWVWAATPYDARKPFAAGRRGASTWVKCDGCGQGYEDPEPWMQCGFCGCLIAPMDE